MPREQTEKRGDDLPSRATVRAAVNEHGEDEWHIECWFPSGNKYAPIVVDGGEEALADWICEQINRPGR